MHYGYDTQSRLHTVQVTKLNGATVLNGAPVDQTTTYEYDAVGNLHTVAQPDGVTTTYMYDDLNRLTDVSAADTAGLVFTQHYNLRFDGLRDNVTETRYTSDGHTVLCRTETQWEYDALGRLASETLSVLQGAVSGLGPYADTFGYDPANNRLTETIGTGTSVADTIAYTYTNDDQLLTETETATGGGTVYTIIYGHYDSGNNLVKGYDVSGNLIEKHRTGTGAENDSYGWDLRGRMISASVNGTTTTYGYDTDGVRISETTGTTTTYYLIDPNNPTGYAKAIEEKASLTGSATRSYVLGLKVEGQSDGTTNGTKYFLTDGHGSTRALVTIGGTVGQSLDYDAYGTALDFNPATIGTTWLYGGDGLYDAATGWTYQLARWRQGFSFVSYDPSMSGDPYSPMSLHKYLYAAANPVMYVDLTGNDFSYTGLLVSMGIGAVLGGTIGGAYAHHAHQSVWKGILIGAGLGAAAGAAVYLTWVAAGNAVSGSLQRFFYDPRSFPTIARQYWQQFGPAAGRSLHHWLIPQRWTWIPQAIRNAGFNLLEMPKILSGSLGLNQWMGFAVRWGGQRMIVAMLTENGVRVLIPVTAYAAYHAGKWVGNELAGEAIKLVEGDATITPLKLTDEEQRQMQDDAGRAFEDELDAAQ